LKGSPPVSSDFPAWVQRDIARLSDARREVFTRFVREMKLRGYSHETILGYVKVIRSLGYDGKPYEELTSEDLMAWMERISSNGWSAETVNWHRRMIKHFLRWLHGCKSAKDPTPEPLRVIQQQRKRRELPKGILSRAEIRRLIDACENQRDRALVFVAYESGARAGEILGVKIGDVEFDRFGAVLHLNRGKTGERRIRLVESVPDLKLWLSMHPEGNNKSATLWPKMRGDRKPLSRDGLGILLRKLARRTGLNKHVHPHLLRHSRATHLANVLTEAQMREFFGWTKDSDMPSVYVHLSGRDVDSALLRYYGIKVEAPAENLLEPKTCPWCKVVNSPSARFCQSCNAPLDPSGASEAAERLRRREEFVVRFIERVLREAPGVGENILKEMRQELEELAESSKVGGT
jgi:integrase/recombinase XerD